MKKITLLLILCLVPVILFSADLHVGSGQTYSTIASAIAASSGGDTIIIHPGTYNEYGLTPKSGSSGDHTVVTWAGETRPVISYTGQVVFNLNNVNYIDLTYLDITGGVGNNQYAAVAIGPDNNSTYITIDHCKITSLTPLDNACALSLAQGSNFTITNNELVGNGYTGSSGSLGVSCIKAWGYAHTNVTIANNYLHDGFQGVGYKWGDNTDNNIIIEKNYIKDIGQRGIYGDQGYLTIRNNVFNNCQRGMAFGENDGAGFGGDYCTADHNTVYGCDSAIVFVYGQNCTLSNNIFYDSSTIVNDAPQPYTSDHNYTSNPNFTDSGSEDFTLAVGSGAIAYCADSSNAGADMSDIGIDGAQAGAGGSEPAATRSLNRVNLHRVNMH